MDPTTAIDSEYESPKDADYRKQKETLEAEYAASSCRSK